MLVSSIGSTDSPPKDVTSIFLTSPALVGLPEAPQLCALPMGVALQPLVAPSCVLYSPHLMPLNALDGSMPTAPNMFFQLFRHAPALLIWEFHQYRTWET